MPKFRVKAPDGKTYEIEAPAGATAEQIQARVTAHAKQATSAPSTRDNIGGFAGNFLDGMLPGASGFLRGARETAINAVTAPFSDKVDFHPIDSYNEGKRFQEKRNAAASKSHPTANAVASGAGMVNGLVLPAAKIARGASLGAKVVAGAKTGGAYGALSGAMSSDKDTVSGKVGDSVSSGFFGALTGAGMPLAFRAGSFATSPFRPIIDPAVGYVGRGIQKVGQQLPGAVGRWFGNEGAQMARSPVQAAANATLDHDLRNFQNPNTGHAYTPEQVGAEVQRRQDMGVPAALADVHESARRSYGAAARAPGPATAAVRRRIDQRQLEATERMGDHIGETLGPTTNVEMQARTMRQEAKEAAKPLYELSDQQDIPFTPELQELLNRPSAHDAIQKAGRQLLDRGENPYKFGLKQDAEGIFRPLEKPTSELYGRMKRVLDKTVYAGHKPFAPLEVTDASEGALDIRNRLLDILDGTDGNPGLNPHFKPARDVYAGKAQETNALELGQQMAGKHGEDIANRMGAMSPNDADFFRLGHRSELAKGVDSVGDWGNAASNISGTAKKRGALEAAHGPRAEDLLDRTRAEHEAYQTWAAVRGNSQTPDRLAEMAAQDQQIEDAAKGIFQVLSGRPGEGTATALKALMKGDRNAAEIKGDMAEKLGSTDMESILQTIKDIAAERARRDVVDRRTSQAALRGGRLLGEVLGTNMIEPTN